ncbi:MAG TPA: FG-GAP-like repeat-containing protein [Pyrinomonadaceae bacterium]|jgi:uncharacterized delta-60 repeat protein
MISNSKELSHVRAPKGVLTHEFFNVLRLIATSLFLIALVFAGENFAQETSLVHNEGDILDQTFNAKISATSYNHKAVDTILPLPDGRILVGGRFNSYNQAVTGSLVRLNADGSLDSTFNSNTIAGGDATSLNAVSVLAVQPDGKILIGGAFTLNGESVTRKLVRLNADGSLDTTFTVNSSTFNQVRRILVRPNGKILVSADNIVQLNSDGSFDNSFNSAVTAQTRYIEFQNGKLLALTGVIPGTTAELVRLNDDGSFDATFNRRTIGLSQVFVQPDGKIIGQSVTMPFLYRFNADGTNDSTFQQTSLRIYRVALAPDGGIIVASGYAGIPYAISRLLPNGAPDASFTTYNELNTQQILALAVQADGKVLIGDQVGGTVTSAVNYFQRLNADGTRDTTFNTGVGFQLMIPGNVEAFAVQPDNKVIIAGRFDLINNVSRFSMARLNEDGTLDDSFQISTTDANRFNVIHQLHNLALQSDGKVIVSGSFTYTVNGTSKADLARLNPDGSLDAGFNLTARVPNYSFATGAGKNEVFIRAHNKLLIGTSRLSNSTNDFAPILVNPDGSRDASFNPGYRREAHTFMIFDLYVQSDDKIVIGGRFHLPDNGTSGSERGFVARLNADGSVDTTFNLVEQNQTVVKALALLADGKILVGRNPYLDETQSEIIRLNSNGSIDSTFSPVLLNGKINSLLRFTDNKILVGGAFTQFKNQPRRNLAVFNADGTLDATLVNVNQEVLSLMADNQGRILVGGAFTIINTGGGDVNRSYLARLNAEPESSSAKPRLDFDGDGRSDLALFNETTGIWTIRSSRTNQTVTTHFGKNGDITAPADYDNDGKTDIAVYRPTEGMWYLQQSTAGFKAVRWGLAEDKPVAADYDGDGRADIAVFRPSSRIWYIMQSSDNQMRAVYFGLATDVPLREVDFDGDGKADIAVYRPSNGGWYWQASGSNNEFRAAQWGASGDIPVAADYNGDGKTDIAVYRPSDGVWYQQLSTESGNYNFAAVQFGLNSDVPVVADYNGDGKADISIRRGEIWALLLSVQGYNGLNFGNASDKAVAAVQP